MGKSNYGTDLSLQVMQTNYEGTKPWQNPSYTLYFSTSSHLIPLPPPSNMKGSLVLLLATAVAANQGANIKEKDDYRRKRALAGRGAGHGLSSIPDTSCNVKGYPSRGYEPYKVVKDGKYCSPDACSALCASDKLCQTSAACDNECRLYDEVM